MSREPARARTAAPVAAVETRVARVPLRQVTSFATRQVSARDYVLVTVTDADGVQGRGFCYAGASGGEVVSAAVAALLGPVVAGRDPFGVERIWQDMYQEALLHGRTGSAMRALSALDIALWDHNARALGLPLHRLLGGFRAETVPAYASGGYYLDGKTPDDLGEELASYVAAGFRAVKMKVGRLSPAEEEERVAAARRAVGDGVLLMLDANNAWSDLPTALRTMDRLARYDPYWIEEPFGPDDIDNHARLAAAIRVPVATGEIEAGRWRHKELLERGAAAVLQTDAAVCGGITEFRRIAATAASFGVPLAPHWFHDLHAHLVAATPNCTFTEFFADDSVLNFRTLVDTQLAVRDGRLVLPAGPGLGFGFDADAVERHTVPGTPATVTA
ncbi:mandelate racemase/muconate lactonizing enzyme family protein [Allonocardiopsis opalescens]|uniref:L-alanine-DL-glutamate epimerase-like enolase superfamily enzyme n=1 Tax=Allonocardiopsis opalescens TaxID=1144618 RepID=A0A2T0QEX8_9ACTN|nr:mandelate racemase/muconate lactonizing enzyme family protein [Allonocardiopsis opalescens]PRY02403.1 L-alanine-DL-glutamate epimerase-like enolase superfamily enzyme [Allonocardiopsis opalescens]